jgi:hypothetical protein
METLFSKGLVENSNVASGVTRKKVQWDVNEERVITESYKTIEVELPKAIRDQWSFNIQTTTETGMVKSTYRLGVDAIRINILGCDALTVEDATYRIGSMQVRYTEGGRYNRSPEDIGLNDSDVTGLESDEPTFTTYCIMNESKESKSDFTDALVRLANDCLADLDVNFRLAAANHSEMGRQCRMINGVQYHDDFDISLFGPESIQ